MRALPAIALAALLTTPDASAQSNAAQVEGFLRRGVALRQQGNDEGALELFLRARAISEEPRVLAQVALAAQALGRWVEAARELRAAMQHDDDPWIRRNASALAGARDEITRHVGGLRVGGDGARGELRVDDAHAATLPMRDAAVVLAGPRALEVRAEGFAPWRRRVDVRAGELTQVEVPALVAEAPAAVAPVAPPPSRGRAQRIAGWSLVGASAIGVGLGVYGLLRRDDANAAIAADGQCATATPPAVCRDRRDTADTMGAVMIAGFVSAGVLAAAGAVLVLTAPSGRPVASVVCAPSWRSVGCAVTF